MNKYTIEVEAIIHEESFSDFVNFFFEYPEEELQNRVIEILLNDTLRDSEYIRLQGLDPDNKKFYYYDLEPGNNKLSLPLGKYEILMISNYYPNFIVKNTFEVKENDTSNIEISLDILNARNSFEKFKYNIEKVTDNSITISWNNVLNISEITFFIESYEDDKRFMDEKKIKITTEDQYTLKNLNR